MELTLRSIQDLKLEAEDIGLQGKDIVCNKTTNTGEREEGSLERCTETEITHIAEEKKRADEIRMAEIEAEAEDKKRANELEAEEKKRADEIRLAQIEADKEQVRIEADKELALKELELKAQQD